MNASRSLLLLSVFAILGLAWWSFARSPRDPAPSAEPSRAAQDLEPAARGTREPDEPLGRAAPPAQLGELEVEVRSAAPLAAAVVSLRLVEADLAREVARATTDSAGRARFALDGIEDLASLPTLLRVVSALEVQAQAPGHQPKRERVALAARAEPPAAPLLLELEPGGEISGRVVDTAGSPVAAALVRRIVDAVELGAPAPRVTTEAFSDARGEFVLAVAAPEAARIVARADGHGTAEVEMEAGASSAGELALGGAGSIWGHLRYVDGRPATEVELWAIPEEIANQRDALVEVVRAAPRHEGSEGLFWCRATTDAEGAFEFDGLAPGVYALRSPRPELSFEPRQGHYQLGANHVRLALEDYRVVVRVRDASGRPLAGVRVACTEMRDADGGGLEAARTLHQTTRGPAGTATFEVEPEAPLVLSASVPGGLAVEEIVMLSPGEFEVVRELVVVEAAEVGRVRVRVQAGGRALEHWTAAVLSETTREPIAGLEALRADAQGWLPPLPPGRARIAIRFDEEAAGPERHAFPIVADDVVEITGGSTHELAFEARFGGRLEVALDFTGRPPEDFDARPAQDDTPAETAREHRRRRGAALRLAGAGGSSLGLEFLVPSLDADGAPIERTSLLLPGERAPVVQLLEPGKYTLEVESLGFRRLELPVTIEAGKTLELAVPMRAL